MVLGLGVYGLATTEQGGRRASLATAAHQGRDGSAIRLPAGGLLLAWPTWPGRAPRRPPAEWQR